ncbi:hypothetical protein A6A05_18180 [Magnetospirillum moscoviense]|uniref:Magnetosome protein MamJ n=1 Tax=Magnetospirillum moscoviense TaxID=1437059 RepID=A0A178N2L5_9PROT|nr:hypothetical protein A6A05_18180 [Magnetospirillum moscoviense]
MIDVQPETNAEIEVSIESEPALVEPVIEIEVEGAEVEPEPALVEPVIAIEAEAAEVEPEPALVEAEPVIEIEAEAAEVEPEPALVEAEPVVEIEAIEVKPEPVLIDEVVELVTEFEYSHAESVASADLIAHPVPAESSRLAELLDEAPAVAAPAVAAPAVAVAVEATRQPNKIAASVKKRAPVQEVHVEDLLGGIFGVARSAVRGVFTIGGGFVDGVVKGGRLVGSNVVAGTRRLAQTIEGSCGSCSSPKCDAEDKNK